MKGNASIVSAAMHTNSPTPSAITMSPIVSIASPLEISEKANIRFALAKRASSRNSLQGSAAIVDAQILAISLFLGDGRK
jgi:hypothetical protein